MRENFVVKFSAEGAASLERVTRSLQNQFRTMSSGIGQAKVALQGLLAIATTSTLANAFKRVVDQMDQLSKQASQLGVATEEMLGFSEAAKSAGLNVQSIIPALNQMQRLIGEAQAGKVPAREALGNLGVRGDRIINALSKADPLAQAQFLIERITSGSISPAFSRQLAQFQPRNAAEQQRIQRIQSLAVGGQGTMQALGQPIFGEQFGSLLQFQRQGGFAQIQAQRRRYGALGLAPDEGFDKVGQGIKDKFQEITTTLDLLIAKITGSSSVLQALDAFRMKLDETVGFIGRMFPSLGIKPLSEAEGGPKEQTTFQYLKSTGVLGSEADAAMAIIGRVQSYFQGSAQRSAERDAAARANSYGQRGMNARPGTWYDINDRSGDDAVVRELQKQTSLLEKGIPAVVGR